jgi:hypothetical protein
MSSEITIQARKLVTAAARPGSMIIGAMLVGRNLVCLIYMMIKKGV